MTRFSNVVAGRQIILCAGPGGVGKTTTSAALALGMAQQGMKTLVITIDPARRLADALGCKLGARPEPVAHVPNDKLWAMMLDPVQTFDELVLRTAPTPALAQELLNNKVYAQVSRAMAGALEYTAVDKLCELRELHHFDLIVVDTPPSKNVLDFVEAPLWLSHFMDERILKWFLMLDPNVSTVGMRARFFKRTGRIIWDVLARVMGEEFTREITTFVRCLETMAPELKRRADAISSLLRSPATLCLIVTSPDAHATDDAMVLARELSERGLHIGGYVVNRVHDGLQLFETRSVDDLLYESFGQSLKDPLREKVRVLLHGLLVRVRQERIVMARLRDHWHGFLGTIPRQFDEVHDRLGLERFFAALTA